MERPIAMPELTRNLPISSFDRFRTLYAASLDHFLEPPDVILSEAEDGLVDRRSAYLEF